jgi:serine/threonine protein kinase
MLDAPERVCSALAARYRLERELGRGGMATVYLAEDLKHRRRVALKLFHPDPPASRQARSPVRAADRWWCFPSST